MLLSDVLAIKGKLLYTISPQKTLADALTLMTEQDMGSLVVIDDGDIELHAGDDGLNPTAGRAPGPRCRGPAIRRAMHRQPQHPYRKNKTYMATD